MKLPRDVSSDELINLLKRLGYVVVRQRGSHVRLSYRDKHHITVPAHKTLKPGLLHAILKDVSKATGADVKKLYELL